MATTQELLDDYKAKFDAHYSAEVTLHQRQTEYATAQKNLTDATQGSATADAAFVAAREAAQQALHGTSGPQVLPTRPTDEAAA